MEKIKLNEAKEMVKTSISSLFTKQDVIELLEKLDTGSTDMDTVKEILHKVKVDFGHELQCVIEQIVDKDNIKLELCGNEILIEDVEVDVEVIEGVLEELIDNLESVLEEQN
jgi:hypothetical protein